MYIQESELMIAALITVAGLTGLIGYVMFLGYRVERLSKIINNKQVIK